MKTRLKGAQKSHSLLKKKADGLNLRFREILRKIVEVSLFFNDKFHTDFLEQDSVESNHERMLFFMCQSQVFCW